MMTSTESSHYNSIDNENCNDDPDFILAVEGMKHWCKLSIISDEKTEAMFETSRVHVECLERFINTSKCYRIRFKKNDWHWNLLYKDVSTPVD